MGFDFDSSKFEELALSGASDRAIAKEMGIGKMTANRRKKDLATFQNVSLPGLEDEEASAPPEPPIGDCEISWSEIEDFLKSGFTLGEAATAAGVSRRYLEELYSSLPDKKYDCLETYASVLRVRRLKEFIAAMEHRILTYGDLRAFHSIMKWRYSRFSYDQPKPPAYGKDT